MRKLTCTLALPLGLGCGDAPDDLDITTAEITPPRPILVARRCRNDVCYVDVPLHLNPAWTNNMRRSTFVSDLQNDANQIGFPWFCGMDQVSCPASPVVVRAEPLLSQRTSPFRGDGHLRFFS